MCNYFDMFICSFSHMIYNENKEKDYTTEHEEICGNYTGTAIFPKVCVFLISCHSLCQICWFLDCYSATIKDLCCKRSVRCL